jgi:hypothetical protein
MLTMGWQIASQTQEMKDVIDWADSYLWGVRDTHLVPGLETCNSHYHYYTSGVISHGQGDCRNAGHVDRDGEAHQLPSLCEV